MSNAYAPVVQSTVVGIQGPAGQGSPGSTEYTGVGAPSSGFGSNGDHYLNTAVSGLGDYYEKQSGAWVLVANLKGPAGAIGTAGTVLRNGAVAPNNGTGIDGDYYLNSVTGDLSQRASGTYGVVANLKGPQGASGSAGATGSAGSTLRNGAGAPSNGLGADGDYYLNTTAGDLYQRLSGAYSNVGNLKGATGSAGVNRQGPLLINSLGDSISARGSYQPTAFIAGVPAWQANTAYSPVGTLVKVGTMVYRLTTAGTSGSAGPTGNNSSADGTAVWQYCTPTALKSSTSWLGYAEAFSDGMLRWDMSQG